ncbi:MAG: response regulator [Oscillospiraceae bacterium]|nr:response regulator [Oscillospiraceae bacterium]
MKYNACILIAHNDPFFISICKKFFSQYNIMVTQVESNYCKIIHAIEFWQPDVVLIDVIIPNSDSVSVMEASRNLSIKRIPMFFVISYVDDHKMKSVNLEHGATQFLLCPFDNYFVLSKIFNSIISAQHSERITPCYCGNRTSPTQRCELAVYEAVANLGVPTNMNGYKYLCRAILYCVSVPWQNPCLGKQIYLTIAEAVNSNAVCIERSIRHAITTAWEGNANLIANYFGISQKPTNMQFISFMAMKFRFTFAANGDSSFPSAL